MPASRGVLLDCLQRLAHPTAAACLVLLWTYYDDATISEAQNALHQAGVQPLRLTPLFTEGLDPGRLRHCVADLGGLVDRGAEFDSYALRLVMSLDRTLSKVAADMARAGDDGELLGVDGRPYQVRRRRNVLSDRYGGTWAAHQGGTIVAFARSTAVVPRDPVGRFHINAVRLADSQPFLDERLLAEQRRLSVMLWSLTAGVDYPDLDRVRAAPPPPFVSLREPRDEEALAGEVARALDAARRERATVLVLPELSITPGVLADVKRTLGGHRVLEDHPVLTVLGLCHVPEPGGADVNEALVLGPDGLELHRHRKLAPFTMVGEAPCGERLLTGDAITVVESEIGNLLILICLDLFHLPAMAAIMKSHADALLVPSLSPATGAHETAAATFQASQLAATFVCNRWLDGWRSGESASFFRVPGMHDSWHNPLECGEYLMFRAT